MSVIRGVKDVTEMFVLNFGFYPRRYHLLCPECGEWNLIDQQQYEGKVSVVCDGVKRGTCSFHETHNLADGRMMSPPESFDSPLAQEATRWIGVRLRHNEWPARD